MKRALLGFVAAVMVACAPAQQATTDVIDNTFGDDATIAFVQGGVQFNPGSKPALGVIVVLQGQSLKALDASSPCKPNTDSTELSCELGDVSAAQTIGVSGQNVTASASYRRTGSNRVYLEVAK
ncbi:hypothetical protein [Deinococcus cellulosilyticus]|uniref:Uncharacterized protein n=1 Tax=Deinococcus cellulosilyticus (strain DSM 18568 / NBRC 106333 / KACC 11606 / 5516J-15) TaxID=1223518 RepID=A0A511N4T2_DEIC1|nr:hypothetical protein [Deinococcus cellulosilyticus]GEM47845.1 hypothetical protein DC3_34800 [Deinococcus cellulosilyticus NBRC 106333 = KACC 11606]